MNAERVLNERDPTQQAIDEAVIDEAERRTEHDREDLAILINNAVVKAFPS